MAILRCSSYLNKQNIYIAAHKFYYGYIYKLDKITFFDKVITN
jgi:hypothetical protein